MILNKEIIDEICKATKDFTQFDGSSEMTKFVLRTNSLGKPMNADPNIRWTQCTIDDKTYFVYRQEWNVTIYDKAIDYTQSFKQAGKCAIAILNLTPSHLTQDGYKLY